MTNTLNEMLVPIDVSKYFHKATIVGPRGEILEDPFEIDIYQEGLQRHKVSGIGLYRAKKIIAHAQSTIHKSCYFPEIKNSLMKKRKINGTVNSRSCPR